MTQKSASWASSAAARSTMRANRGKDTGPELRLRRELHSRGLRFFVNRRPIAASRRTADVLFPAKRIAVFIDGCFWHGCPQHYVAARTNAHFWAEKVHATRQRDEDTNALLREQGWIVLRVWEHVPVEAAADQVEALVRGVV